ncbi:MAG: glycine dehydrogenase (aminomethyl-transferring) [Marinilabiliales bacterium]|nr:MAG: glycine dehydrogenase (aminomethyl-transferring) [Marinilabiliales bacterium]
MKANTFLKRHNGPNKQDVKKMLESMGLKAIEQLIDETVPKSIRLDKPLNLGEGMSEYEYLNHIRTVAKMNKVFKSYIGMGYYNTISPSVIIRNVFENPGWYTSYTPYQAEISQGRLEALMNFQTMISDLTGMPLANASLLDEGTAAAEAMIMLFHARPRTQVKVNANKFLVSDQMLPQTLDILKIRAASKDIELVVKNVHEFEFNEDIFGCMVQYPNQKGDIVDHSETAARANEHNVPIAVAADLLSLALLTPPGEWGAKVVFGNSQRFGVPMGYGGPHAAFFATTEDYKRFIPGRIIGISKDVNGNNAYRMALQTREQHIKRERATSNICTAQALLAIMAGFYGVYHGKEGIKGIATKIHMLAIGLSKAVEKLGYKQLNDYFFDTLYIQLPEGVTADQLKHTALEQGVNFRYFADGRHISISLDETTSEHDVALIMAILTKVAGKEHFELNFKELNGSASSHIQQKLQRKSTYLEHPVFNQYHSETDMMRYMKKLENKDIALNRSMIPLGSCTMKLNAASELIPISWPEFANLHPFVPVDQVKGYSYIIDEMDRILSEVTGFAAMSFQPNSGAAGEYTGLMVIREYQKSKGEGHRNICLIPASAHGTNPASAIMAGMEIIVIKTDASGNIDLDDLKEKAEANKEMLSAIMVTYPSTHGVFEEGIVDVMDIIHENGGQVYMDGANMNAQVGLTSPGFIGADVCHLNLHKTFAIPHGGGGPGVGPIGVAEHLKDFLPTHLFAETGGKHGIPAIAAAPFGSALVLLISYGYLKMLGAHGLTEATKIAILNANYLMHQLKDDYPILYTGKNGHVGHEMILDCNQFSKSADITVVDIAKRLMDFGFHAPTVAFPVHGTLMVEPTESEPLSEMDYFIDAMKSIREEIREVEEGKAERKNNVVSNAPHTAEMVISDDYQFPYSREKAAYPSEWVRDNKYFTPVGKIDDAYGDRNLCACLPMEAYGDGAAKIKTEVLK